MEKEYIVKGREIYRKDGKEALTAYLTSAVSTDNIDSEFHSHGFLVHCPSCGLAFAALKRKSGKLMGIISGATAGAVTGAKFGIAGGPIGAIAGTVPGAIIGGIFGRSAGSKFDKPNCPNCKIGFDLPSKGGLKRVRILEKEIAKIAERIMSTRVDHSKMKFLEVIRKSEELKAENKNKRL